jgi:hypothetical protein
MPSLLCALIRLGIALPAALIEGLREQPFDYESRTSR